MEVHRVPIIKNEKIPYTLGLGMPQEIVRKSLPKNKAPCASIWGASGVSCHLAVWKKIL